MKHNKGFIGVGIIIAIIIALAAGGALYYAGKNSTDSTQTTPENSSEFETEPENTPDLSGTPEVAEGEVFSSYIKKIYTVDNKTFIDADYFQTLRGKDAVSRAIRNNSCYLNNVSKEQALATVNSLSDDPSKFEDEFYKLPFLEGCFNNGVWLDVNDNPKIRTFEVDLQKPILMQYAHDQFGETGQPPFLISLDILKKIFSEKNYMPKIPFQILVSDNKITEIQEIYRP